MSIVKSFAIGNGDMYYIRHGSDNFTIIDCNLPEDRSGSILAEIATQSKDKGITRFISTHPDQDHISGLTELDETIGILNFYCVANQATKKSSTTDFKLYCKLRDDPKKAFHLYKGCSRRWMNKSDDTRGQAGIDIGCGSPGVSLIMRRASGRPGSGPGGCAGVLGAGGRPSTRRSRRC